MILFERIVKEKIIIDPVIWLIEIQNIKVNKNYKECLVAMEKMHSNNPLIIKKVKEYLELWGN